MCLQCFPLLAPLSLLLSPFPSSVRMLVSWVPLLDAFTSSPVQSVFIPNESLPPFLSLPSSLVLPIPSLLRAPHFHITESTSVAFATLWWLRKTGQEHHPLYKISAVSFLLGFVALRLVNLPVAMCCLWKSQREWQHLRPMGEILTGSVAIQYYWSWYIAKAFLPMFRGSTPPVSGAVAPLSAAAVSAAAASSV